MSIRLWGGGGGGVAGLNVVFANLSPPPYYDLSRTKLWPSEYLTSRSSGRGDYWLCGEDEIQFLSHCWDWISRHRRLPTLLWNWPKVLPTWWLAIGKENPFGRTASREGEKQLIRLMDTSLIHPAGQDNDSGIVQSSCGETCTKTNYFNYNFYSNSKYLWTSYGQNVVPPLWLFSFAKVGFSPVSRSVESLFFYCYWIGKWNCK